MSDGKGVLSSNWFDSLPFSYDRILYLRQRCIQDIDEGVCESRSVFVPFIAHCREELLIMRYVCAAEYAARKLYYSQVVCLVVGFDTT